MNEDYIVTFYFTSGETMLVTYSQEELSKMFKTLKNAWHQCCIADNNFGINFSQVTHYKVRLNQ